MHRACRQTCALNEMGHGVHGVHGGHGEGIGGEYLLLGDSIGCPENALILSMFFVVNLNDLTLAQDRDVGRIRIKVIQQMD